MREESFLRLCREFALHDEAFALPSVLMLVTVLSLLSFAVLELLFLEHQLASKEISQVKAQYAAESGIACELSHLSAVPELGFVEQDSTYLFADGSSSRVRVHPWGAVFLIESQGVFKHCMSTRRATIGCTPHEAFENALVLGNSSHQLVFTGDASVNGDVAIGAAGVTTGSLYGHSTPIILPIKGKVKRLKPHECPQCSNEFLRGINHYYDYLMESLHRQEQSRAVHENSRGSFQGDSVLLLPRGGVLNDSVFSPTQRLFIASNGPVCIGPRAKLRGLITVLSGDSIKTLPGADLQGTVLVSKKSIHIFGSHLASVECLAGRIWLDSGTVMKYPGILLSLPTDSVAAGSQQITIKAGVLAEGFVAMLSPSGDDALILEAGSSLTGSVFTQNRLTLDGTLRGSAVAEDLFFYEAPSTYLGWMRSGTVERALLPRGFLTPPIFDGVRDFRILEWL